MSNHYSFQIQNNLSQSYYTLFFQNGSKKFPALKLQKSLSSSSYGRRYTFGPKNVEIKFPELDLLLKSIFKQPKPIRYGILELKTIEDLTSFIIHSHELLLNLEKLVVKGKFDLKRGLYRLLKTAVKVILRSEIITNNFPTTQKFQDYLKIMSLPAHSLCENELKDYLEVSHSKHENYLNDLIKIEQKQNFDKTDIENIFYYQTLVKKNKKLLEMAVDADCRVERRYGVLIQKTLQKIENLIDDILELPQRSCALEAARRGNARLLTVENALEEMRSDRNCLNRFGKTAQKVFLQEDSVIKALTARAEVEEKMIQQCFSIDGTAGIVPFYNFKRLSFENLRLSLDQLIPAKRRYQLSILTPNECGRFYRALKDPLKQSLFKLTHLDLVPNYVTDKITLEEKRRDYLYFSKEKFIFSSSKQFPPFIISFEELVKLLNNKSLEDDCIIQLVDSESEDIFYFSNIQDLVVLQNGSRYNLSNAIVYHSYQIDRTNDAFFTPLVLDDSLESSYEACENQIWQYKDLNGQWKTVSFQELYKLWICNQINSSTLVRIQLLSKNASLPTIPEEVKRPFSLNIPSLNYLKTCKGITIQNENYFNLKKVLKTPVNYIVPEIVQLNPSSVDHPFLPLCNISGKPLISPMYEFSFFSKNPKAQSAILEKIDHEDTFKKTFKLLIHQFLDVHEHNVGVGPDTNYPDYQFMDSFLYYPSILSTDLSSLKEEDFFSLNMLILAYLNEDIDENTKLVIYNPQNKKIFRPVLIKDNQKLLDILNCSWNIYLFDCDRVMGESENIFTFSPNPNGTASKTLIPLRWHLLCSPQSMKKPLTKENLNYIKKYLKNEKLESWLFGKERFPWKFVRKKNHLILEQLILLKARQPQFTLSFYTNHDKKINIDLLANLFGTYLSDLNSHQGFWDTIHDWLKEEPNGWYTSIPIKNHCIYFNESPVLNRKKTLENVAQAYGLNYKEICSLNPETWSTFTKNCRLVVHADLNKHSTVAAKQRELFAKNLFPRETYRQQESRKNRIKACETYLSMFERLEKSVEKFNKEKLYPHDAFYVILTDSITPFNSQQIEELKDKVLSVNLNDEDKMSEILNIFLEAYRPTQFKLACVMYPFLADYYWILSLIAKKNSDFSFYSNLIGNYSAPMEAVIQEAKALTSDPKLLKRIVKFEERIKEERIKQTKLYGSTFDGGCLVPIVENTVASAPNSLSTSSSSTYSRITDLSSHSRITLSSQDSQLEDDD